MSRLKQLYKTQVISQLQEQLQLGNVTQVPKVTKITLNMGVGEGIGDKKMIENAVADMQRIAGQKPIVTYARKSVAGFKVREGWPIGCKVTLRGRYCYSTYS
jgi:large subunit ribosomal protein L5